MVNPFPTDTGKRVGAMFDSTRNSPTAAISAGVPGNEAEVGQPRGPYAEILRVRELMRARARRTDHLSERLFSDPAWDILLDLYLADLLQCRVTVSSLGTTADIPPTTVLRWIKTLSTEALIEKAPDKYDNRRTFVSLTTTGRAAMQNYFAGFDEPPVMH